MISCVTQPQEINVNTWYRLNLGNGADALTPTKKIQQTFTAMLIAGGATRPDWALFSRYDLKADCGTSAHPIA